MDTDTKKVVYTLLEKYLEHLDLSEDPTPVLDLVGFVGLSEEAALSFPNWRYDRLITTILHDLDFEGAARKAK